MYHSFLVWVICLTTVISCTSGQDNSSTAPVENNSGAVSSAEDDPQCQNRRHYYKHYLNHQDNVGFIPIRPLERAISDHKRVVNSSKTKQKRCYYNLMILNMIIDGRIDHAIVWARKILEFYPGAVLARYFIALGYFMQNDLSQSLYTLNTILDDKLGVHLGLVYNLYGLIYYRLNEASKAAVNFKLAIDHSDRHEIGARLNLAFLALAFNNGQQAIDALLSFQSEIKSYERNYALGMGFLLIQDFDRAVIYFDTASQIKPDASLPTYHLGKIYYKYLKQPKKAVKYLEMFLRKKDRYFYAKRNEVELLVYQIGKEKL